jgi:uncharacterized protein (TIGR00730 family)
LTRIRVTVFGGSKPKSDEPAYIQALELGTLLGSASYTVLTGGYIGTMEAVSRGAAENGGYVIGVTCDEIEKWRPVGPNQWIQEEIRYSTLRQRLLALIDGCDAALALPGGVGTLTELAMMWNQLLTLTIPKKPLILIGSEWQTVINSLYNLLGEYIPQRHRDYISFAPDVCSAFLQLQETLSNGKV